jgi:hypothetical protein
MNVLNPSDGFEGAPEKAKMNVIQVKPRDVCLSVSLFCFGLVRITWVWTVARKRLNDTRMF